MAEESSLTFTNPVIRGFNPDPTICVVPATDSTPTTFFLSTSTFEFFPGCAIYTSTNLIDWTLIGHALNRRSQIDMRTVEPGAGSWASTLRYRPEERRWYLANGVFHRYRPTVDERIFPRGFYVWTDNIWDDNAWSDPVYFDNPGFDQDDQLFWDDDGKVYLSTTMRFAWRDPNSKQKDFGIHISEIDISTGRTLTAPKVIRKSPHGIAEGSHIFKREAGHQEWVFRSKDGPLGPWESRGKPLWYNGPDEEVQRTGHVDVFEDGNGDWWSVLLGVRPVQHQGTFLEPQLGRETFLVKVEWKDDWPIFNDGNNITLKTTGRDLIKSASKPSLQTWKADLSKDDLELGWYQKNTPIKQSYTLTEKPSVLRIYGNCYDLTSPEAPAMLLRKQTSYNQTFKVKMEFKPTVRGYEAGAVLWWSQHSYASLGVKASQHDDGKIKTKISYKGAAEKTNEFKTLETDFGDSLQNVKFSIRAYPTKYELSLKAGGKESEVYTVDASALTVMPPHGGCFAGTMFGIYSYGKNQPVLDPADFSEISTEELE
ncbi:Putative beta-xylosidase [Fusarium odoratissimum]|uniref:Putative beta-xylosidase n=1 Tax=Fusarium oxysporum f. sp. cubense (strain race 4) TaxID=2502994 RepID=N1RW88_FUSC4|nr:Putative beta-xylosidase [Fusarium odoratissimum]